MTKEDQLKKLLFGSISAEDDEELKDYFIETPVFEDLLRGHKDIVVGRKGAGKSALLKILLEKQGLLKEIDQKLLVPIENPSRMFELDYVRERISDGVDYRFLWCLLISFYLTKYLLEVPIAALLDSTEIRAVLAGTSMEEDVSRKRPILEWLRTIFGKTYVSIIYEGAEYRIGVQPAVAGPKRPLDVTKLLSVADKLLAENKREAWILIDRLDEVLPLSQTGAYKAQEMVLVGLMQAYSDLRAFRNLKTKIFVRKDIWDRLQFDTKDHFSDRKIEICWEPAHLKRLIAKRIQLSLDPKKHTDTFTDALADEYFDRTFDKEIDDNGKKINTFDWLLKVLSDGNSFISPRDFLNVSMKSQQRQIDYYNRGINNPKTALISQQAVHTGFQDACQDKLNDYLYGVFGHVKDKVQSFRGTKKRVIGITDIKETLNITQIEDVYLIVDELCNIGFLKMRDGPGPIQTQRFEIVPLYAIPLGIEAG